MRSGRDRVEEAKRLLALGGTYPQGCSELVCKVLGIPWENANTLLGTAPTEIGSNGSYRNVAPGAVVGWKRVGESGHVAIYVGEPGMKFIDVRAPGATPRKLGNGYGAQTLVQSSKY